MRGMVIVSMGVALALAISPGLAGAQGCAQQGYDDFFAAMQAPWPTWANPDISAIDVDWDGIPDPFQAALLAAAMCRYPAIQAAYDANLAAVNVLIAGDDDYWLGADGWSMPDGNATQIAVYSMWDSTTGALMWYFWMWEWPTLIPVPALQANGDLDQDGRTNLEEYQDVAAVGGGPMVFAQAAMDANNIWEGNPAVPVVGLVGLGLLAGACALGGALSLRKK